MARQSLRKRSLRYQERIQIEFDRFQRLLLRQQLRLSRGDYSAWLTPKKRQKVMDLLYCGIVFVPPGYVAAVSGTAALEKSRRAYYQICSVLRKAGNKRSRSKPSSNVIIRRSRPPLETQIP